MKYRRYANSVLVMSLALMLGWNGAVTAVQEKSADEVAKELTNPAGSLASLSNTRNYTTYRGDLPGTAVSGGCQISTSPRGEKRPPEGPVNALNLPLVVPPEGAGVGPKV